MCTFQMLSMKLLVSIFAMGGIFFLALNEKFTNEVPSNYDTILETEPPDIKNSQEEFISPMKNVMDTCRLPELDPWDEEIYKFLQPNKDPLKNCKKKINVTSKLEDGKVVIDEKFANVSKCAFRCLYHKTDFTLVYGNWKDVNATDPDCDIVEVQCRSSTTGTAFYKYLHAQIYAPEQNTLTFFDSGVLSNDVEIVSEDLARDFPSYTPKAPDVHIILIDSVSASQVFRSMPKTTHILREDYGAIPFKHVNKVGLNSRPNGFALLLGKQIYTIEEGPLSKATPSDYKSDVFCKRSLDGDQFIGYKFQDAGYKTLMSEDWALGVFNWPNCKGFRKQPTDHYMRPFQLRVEGGHYGDSTIQSNVYKKSCLEPHNYQLDYLQQFIDTYPEKPKFSITWMSYMAHDDANGLYHVDEDFYRLFKEYREKLKNSYIFLMSDHGHRFGSIRATKVGEVEDNNPFLYLVLPEEMQKNKTLMDIVAENSKNLVNHYDTYATFFDITSNFTFARNSSNSTILHGSSLFKPLPQPRSCQALRIPFEYCTCQFEKVPVEGPQEFLQEIGKFMVSWLNEELVKNNVSSKCEVLSLDVKKPVRVEEFEPDGRMNIYRVTIKVNPSGGEFWGYAQKHYNSSTGTTWYSMVSDRMPRLNSYRGQSNCINNPRVTPVCYCKNLKGKAKVQELTSGSKKSSTSKKVTSKQTSKGVATSKMKDTSEHITTSRSLINTSRAL